MAKAKGRMRYDFHTHTFLSDGELSPIELINRARALGHAAVVPSDHVGLGNVETVVKQLVTDCRMAEEEWDIWALPGVEITHVPPRTLDKCVKAARKAGAEIVVVHGETIVEPVPEGTNAAAVTNGDVDVLAHPGLLTVEQAEAAKANGVFLEITTRRGHSLTNGHVARVGKEVGCEFVLDSDAHAPGDLVPYELARKTALGATFTPKELGSVLSEWPRKLLKRTGRRV